MMYFLTSHFGKYLFSLVCGYSCKGVENVPKKGGVILVCNHSSFMDPPLVAAAILHRQMNFMARATLFRNRLFGWYIRSLKAFPVKRGGADRDAWRAFQAKIDNGEVVLLFPEGTRTPNGKLLPGNPGSGMLIHRCKNAQVVPVRIFGHFEAWARQG